MLEELFTSEAGPVLIVLIARILTASGVACGLLASDCEAEGSALPNAPRRAARCGGAYQARARPISGQ